MSTTHFETVDALPDAVRAGLEAGTLAPYLGAGMLALCGTGAPPANPLALAGVLTAKVSVPGKIKNRLTAAAQFIENFKHRKTLVKAMDEAFAAAAVPSPLHHWIAHLRAPLIVDTLVRRHDAQRAARGAPAGRLGGSAGPVAERTLRHLDRLVRRRRRGAARPDPGADAALQALGRPRARGQLPDLRQRLRRGADRDRHPDADPAAVQLRRAKLGFVFLGCRFNDQLPRAFARQIMKRSAGPHFAVLPDEPTRMEKRASLPSRASRASRCRWRRPPPCSPPRRSPPDLTTQKDLP